MADTSKIEWTDATWNPTVGCTKVSGGCDHCYAATFAERWRGVPGHPFEQGFDLRLWPERLALPLTWRRSKRVFVNSMSDLFIGRDQVPDPFIAAVWATMFWTSPEGRQVSGAGRSANAAHTYQILTKRPARMRSWLARWGDTGQRVEMLADAADRGWADEYDVLSSPWMPAVLSNVWLGVSAEDQHWADVRIPALLETPAAVRFVSAEPLLGPIDLTGLRPRKPLRVNALADDGPRLDWVIVGGESGPGARPMHPEWAGALRDQCTELKIPYFFKQWGAWTPRRLDLPDVDVWTDDRVRWVDRDGGVHEHGGWTFNSLDDGWAQMQRTSKKAAGRVLDGRTWDEMPGRVPAEATS